MTNPLPLESTQLLLDRIRSGDELAREKLVARFLPAMRAWAHGRLPGTARGLADTDDLVQITLVRAMSRLQEFEYRHEGALLAYLRQSMLNTLRQEIRRASRRPSGPEADESTPDPAASVLEQVIGRETLDRYEKALLRLTEDQREATIMRLEFGYSYPEIAEAMGKQSANAARMIVVRALVILAEQLGERIA